MAIHDGDGPLVPECIIWDIDDSDDDVYGLYEGPVFDDILVANVEDNQIFGPDGGLECTAYEENGLFKLRDGLDGEVLFTATPGRYVFQGDVQQLPTPGSYAWHVLLWTDLVIEYYGPLVYGGPRGQQALLGTADQKLHRANAMRKLAIAAMYGAECGSDGPRVIEMPPEGPPGGAPAN
ncbi:MAG: hypothetical protein AAGA54_03625 [Myxococcota bacterium]